MLRRKPQSLLLLLPLLLLAACNSLGTVAPETFNQKLAYGIAAHTAVLQATTSAVTAGTLSSSDAESVLKQADTAKAVLDAAQTANAAGDTAGAGSKLATALTALQALQDYLRAHGAKT